MVSIVISTTDKNKLNLSNKCECFICSMYFITNNKMGQLLISMHYVLYINKLTILGNFDAFRYWKVHIGYAENRQKTEIKHHKITLSYENLFLYM